MRILSPKSAPPVFLFEGSTRINDENEALDIGIEDYFYDNHWCLIEWPQNIKNLLPLEAIEIHLSILEDGKRNIHIK